MVPLRRSVTPLSSRSRQGARLSPSYAWCLVLILPAFHRRLNYVGAGSISDLANPILQNAPSPYQYELTVLLPAFSVIPTVCSFKPWRTSFTDPRRQLSVLSLQRNFMSAVHAADSFVFPRDSDELSGSRCRLPVKFRSMAVGWIAISIIRLQPCEVQPAFAPGSAYEQADRCRPKGGNRLRCQMLRPGAICIR